MKMPLMLKLEEAINSAIDRELGQSAEAIARLVMKQEAKLIEALMLLTMTLKVRRMMKPRPDSRQMFLDFRSLRTQLPVRDKTIVLAKATLPVLKKALGTIRAKARNENPKVKRLEALIKAMEPYARKIDGLTVEQFHEMMRVKELV